MSVNYRDFLLEFVRAATTPSLPALIGTLSVAVIILLSCLIFLTPDLMAKYGYYFMESPEDDYAYLTTKTLKISHSVPDKLGVVLVGNSASKEAVNTNYLAKVLSKNFSQPIPVHKLAVGGLFLVEEICILDNIKESFQGVIVIQIEPSRLAFDKKVLTGGITRHSRLAMYCPAFDQEMKIAGVEPQHWSGNYFIDHYKFFVARLPSVLINTLRGPVHWDAYSSDNWLVPTQRQWEKAVKRFARWQENYFKNREDNFGIYARLIERLHKENIKVVLLETTVNPRTEELIYQTPEKKKLYEQYYAEVNQFSQENAVSYWDVSDQADLKIEDFIDHIHIRDRRARQRYTEVLAAKLTNLLNDMELKEQAKNTH